MSVKIPARDDMFETNQIPTSDQLNGNRCILERWSLLVEFLKDPLIVLVLVSIGRYLQ
jgi:hypothetical protein